MGHHCLLPVCLLILCSAMASHCFMHGHPLHTATALPGFTPPRLLQSSHAGRNLPTSGHRPACTVKLPPAALHPPHT